MHALLLMTLVALPTADPAEADAVRALSFNIRYANAGDAAAGNGWPSRRDVVAAIMRERAELVGAQEVLLTQLDDLKARLPEFAWEGVGRSDGKTEGEFCPIGWRADRFGKLDAGVFWLSETPDVPGSVGWDAALPRIATWVRLRDKTTGHKLLAVNVHLDHRGAEARTESAKLVRGWIADHAAGDAVVLTGDFNTRPDTPPYAALTADGPGCLTDARLSVKEPTGPAGTWNGFQKIEPEQRIDFVFLSGPVTATAFATIDETHDGRFPSDHLPIAATLSLKPAP